MRKPRPPSHAPNRPPPQGAPRTGEKTTPGAFGRPAAPSVGPSSAKPGPASRPAPRPPAAAVPPAAGPAGGPWLWGSHAVLAALANPDRKIQRLVATEEAAATLPPPDDMAPAAQIMTRDEITRLLPAGAVHQGLALLARSLRPVHLDALLEEIEGQARPVILALDQVTDPHNIGAVLRSAAAFGAVAVILPDRNAPEVSGTLAKAASGAVEHVPLVRVVNLTRAFEQMKKAGFWIVGLAGEADKTLARHDLSGKVCLVLGSEGDGMRRLTREGCDLMARLPTQGPISSLNVSNAAAIALYELNRAG